MCECFGRADYQVEHLPPRYYGGPPTKRISLIRNIDQDYEDVYTRPRSSAGSMKQIEYRPAKAKRRDNSEDRDKSQYKAPPKIDYPKTSPRFVALPPVLREEEIEDIREPKKSILRKGKQKYSSQPSMVVYSPKRGRRDRKYYYEDESDGDSWDGNSGRTEWSEASGDSWAIRPVKKYATTRRKGRSQSRGNGYHK